jgi:hypothetical protein
MVYEFVFLSRLMLRVRLRNSGSCSAAFPDSSDFLCGGSKKTISPIPQSAYLKAFSDFFPDAEDAPRVTREVSV